MAETKPFSYSEGEEQGSVMFASAAFVDELANQIAHQLRNHASEFANHRLGAVAVDAAPWNKGTFLCLLIETDQSRKWDLASWEHYEFAELNGSPLMMKAYEELQDVKGKGSRYAPFFRCCAQALCHKAVKAALKLYTLEHDFELFIDDPDDPNEVNYCEEILGVNRKKRKPKTTIVNDLDEALKDPSSVVALKYWFRDKFTKREDERIAQLKNLEMLSLNSMGLKSLPRCVPSLSKLIELDLDHNQITRLTGLRSLTQLTLLSLRDNGGITLGMAKEISALGSLRSLRVGNCGLREVPASWQGLQLLEEIFLFGNPLTTIPDWIPELPNLKRLGLVDVMDRNAKRRLRKQYPHLEIW
jgi:hypothetical protein